MWRVSSKLTGLRPDGNTPVFNSPTFHRQDPLLIRDTLGIFSNSCHPFPLEWHNYSDILEKKMQGDVSKDLYVFSVFRPDSMKLFCKWTKVNYMWPQLSNLPHASIDTIVLLHAQLCNLRGHYWKLASRVHSAFTIMKELLCESQPELNWVLHLKPRFTFFVICKEYSISSVNLKHNNSK